MKYYFVKCKFGHVGRDKYLPLIVPVIAENPKQASIIAKNIGGVKRDHKDWCLESPSEVSYEEYLVAKQRYLSDIYWNKRTRQNLNLFQHRLVDEPNYHRHNGIKTNKLEIITKKDESVNIFKQKKNKVIINSLLDTDWFLDETLFITRSA